MALKFTFFCFALSILISTVRSQSDSEVECIDKLEEFNTANWRYPPSWLYSESSAEFPEGPLQTLKGLSGNGIFYLEGDKGYINAVARRGGATDRDSVFLYIKYATLLKTNSSAKLWLQAVKDADPSWPWPDYTVIPNEGTNGASKWTEALIEMKPRQYLVQFGIWDFDTKEFLLVDKLILSHGTRVDRVEDLKVLCGWPEEEEPEPTTAEAPSTTTTVSRNTTTTTERPGCTAEGDLLPDLGDCRNYYICIENVHGEFDLVQMTCAPNTIFCQNEQKCGWQTVFCKCLTGFKN